MVEEKKYSHLAVSFSIRIFIVLVLFFSILTFLLVRTVKNFSEKDYSSFSEKVIEEDAGKISNWNETATRLAIKVLMPLHLMP